MTVEVLLVMVRLTEVQRGQAIALLMQGQRQQQYGTCLFDGQPFLTSLTLYYAYKLARTFFSAVPITFVLLKNGVVRPLYSRVTLYKPV